MKYYTGVGSRETPEDILAMMTALGKKLATDGWTLRSGGATGADAAFELGWFDWYANQTPWPSQAQAEIYIPWEGYNGHDRDGCFGANINPELDSPELHMLAEMIAEKMHPNWKACKRGARAMHARNVYQVLGRDLKTPSKMLVAWTPLTRAGLPTGGTATAIKLAESHKIACFNLNKPVDFERIQIYLGEPQ